MPLRKSNPPPTSYITPISSVEPVPSDTPPPANTTTPPKASRILIPCIGGIVGVTSGSIIQHFTNLPAPLYFGCFLSGISCFASVLPNIAIAVNCILKSITASKDADVDREIRRLDSDAERKSRELDSKLEREIRKAEAQLEIENKRADAQLAREAKEKAIETNRALHEKEVSICLDSKEILFEQLNEQFALIIPTLTNDENYNRRAEAVLRTIAQDAGIRQTDPETLRIYQELLDYNQLNPIIHLIDKISSLHDDNVTSHLQY